MRAEDSEQRREVEDDETRAKLIVRLLGHIKQLNDDELAVIVSVAEGAATGHEKIGPLNIGGDPRKFGTEAMEEVRDGLFYVGAYLMRFLRQEGPGGR